VRLFGVCVPCCVAGLLVWSGVASAETSSVLGGTGGSAIESPLVVPAVESLDEGEQVRALELARLASPEAVVAREESLTRYEHLDGAQAAQVDGEAFPVVLDEPAGGPPRLSVGQSITAFPNDDAALVALPEGKRGLVESSLPMAIEASSGHRAAVDLGLSEVGGAFEPKTPVVGVRIPKRVGDGVALAGTGVSLTPVDGQGAPLAGAEGLLVGASAVFANTQADADTVVKPITQGFEEDTILRSEESPQQLSFEVGLPEGASLVQAKDGSGAVLVVKEGVAIARVLAPGARDAAGTSVPVSMSVSGTTLTLAVADHSGEYLYPVDVDPTVIDERLDEEYSGTTNWREEPAPPSPFSFSESNIGERYTNTLEDSDNGTPYARGEWGAMGYETQGESHIYEFSSETWASNAGANIENKLAIRSAGKGTEKEVLPGSSYSVTKEALCVESGCATGKAEAANEHNAAEFRQTATNSGSAFSSTMRNVYVYILQEQGPTITGVNTASKTIDGQPNIFYPGTWVGPKRGMAEVTASDPGVGIGLGGFYATSPNKAGWSSGANDNATCRGVQCSQSVTGIGWEAGSLPSGEDTMELGVYDGVGLDATKVNEKLKVDAAPPYDISLSGLPANKELGDEQATLKATAKDERSGIESIALKIDGKEVGSPSGSCSPGPCTATSSGTTISGAEYPAGQNKLIVTVTSYAGDVAQEEYTFDTGHLATPVALGPGSVSPETGEFFLNDTDVSLNGPGATLLLKRS
jgi:hypothetical protein